MCSQSWRGSGGRVEDNGSPPSAPTAYWSSSRNGVLDRFQALARNGALDLPGPGAGETWERWSRLAALTAEDVSLGRLCEGHADAVAILAEAGMSWPRHAVLGVWAAEGPDSMVEARQEQPWLVVSGRRAYCSGAQTLTHALLAVRLETKRRLVLLDLGADGLAWEAGSWAATGMARTDSRTLLLSEVRIGPECGVGGDEFYIERPGFWMGAMGVAACWWGGARAITDAALAAVEGRRDDTYRLARVGAMYASVEATGSLLREAARQCDAGVDKPTLRRLALTARAEAARTCAEVLEGARGVLGSAPLCHDAALGRRVADLYVYVSQFREGAELADLATAALDAWDTR